MSHVKLATQRQATGAQQLGVRLTALPGMHETPTAGRQGNLRGGVETPRSRTSFCLGKASPPGLPAHCSLHSSAASSPPGLRWVWTAACSYSTHRLPSESSEAGGPVGARVWGTPFGGGGKSDPPGWELWSPGRLPPASGGSALASHVARLHTPVGLCLRLGTCTSRLLAFLVGRGLGDTATTPAASPWPGLGTAASGAGTGIWTVASSHEVVGGPTPALPWGGCPGLTVF